MLKSVTTPLIAIVPEENGELKMYGPFDNGIAALEWYEIESSQSSRGRASNLWALRIRLLSRALLPPHIPNLSFVSNAKSKHSERTLHSLHIALARRSLSTSPGAG